MGDWLDTKQRLPYDLRDIRGRIRIARLVANRRVTWLAKKLGITKRAMVLKLAGGRATSTGQIYQIATLLRVRPLWLMSGEGPTPWRIAKALEIEGAFEYIDQAGVYHPRTPMTELMYIMGPYLSIEAALRDRSPQLIASYDYVTRHCQSPALARACAIAAKERPARSIP